MMIFEQSLILSGSHWSQYRKNMWPCGVIAFYHTPGSLPYRDTTGAQTLLLERVPDGVIPKPNLILKNLLNATL